jgi:hypothetical protein
MKEPVRSIRVNRVPGLGEVQLAPFAKGAKDGAPRKPPGAHNGTRIGLS